ncbi:TetR/AcrR family transcriptional regulator C-terminal domain-containing protein [Nocardia sp. NPDC051756]|uniref:TetR/AcrR family transcriptional regulator C-terminal domain-containing protein n=1 Tax=Nocardia sp. NPDC051756 TaxID=3154751 RepID=UPI003428BD67
MNRIRAGPGDGPPARKNSPLTRAAMLAAALEIIDAGSVDQLSMRRLGAALGRDPMVLYRHAANKAAVLDGVAEIVFAQLSVDATDPDWQHQLRVVARDFRRLAVAHPNVVPLLVAQPLATPIGLRPMGTLLPLEHLLALLTHADFSGTDALHIYRALFGFLYGHVLSELQEVIERPEETTDLLRMGLNRLPIGEFPLLRGLASDLAAYDGLAELELGLDILINGLTTTITPMGDAETIAAQERWDSEGGAG